MESTGPNSFYANDVIAFGSENDFTIKFRRVMPILNAEEKVTSKTTDEMNVAVSPVLFKKMITAMQDQLQKHEKAHGEVKVTPGVKQYPAN